MSDLSAENEACNHVPAWKRSVCYHPSHRAENDTPAGRESLPPHSARIGRCAMTGLTRDEAGVLMTALDVFYPENGGDYESVIRAVEAILANRAPLSDNTEKDTTRERVVALVADLADTLSDPTQAWDIAVADFNYDVGRLCAAESDLEDEP